MPRTPRNAASQNHVNFTNHPKDGHELKIYIENGCCDGLKYEEIVEKYPQFQKFRRGYIVQNLRRFCDKFREKIEFRMKVGDSKIQLIFPYLFNYYFSLILSALMEKLQIVYCFFLFF